MIFPLKPFCQPQGLRKIEYCKQRIKRNSGGVEDNRKFDRSGTQRRRKFKQDLSQYKENDIKDALRKGAIHVLSLHISM
jgi:hypothetical protein